MCGVGEYSNTLIYCTLPRAVFSAAHRLTSEMFTVAMEKKQNILSQEIVSWAIALIVIDSRCKSSFWPSHWWLCLFLATIQIQCICCRCEVPIVRSRQLESSHVLHLYQLCHNIWARSLEVLCVNVMASPPPPIILSKNNNKYWLIHSTGSNTVRSELLQFCAIKCNDRKQSPFLCFTAY